MDGAQSGYVVRLRRLPSTAIDTRLLFRVYAWAAIAIGAGLAGSGFVGIPGLALERASLIWIGGAALIAGGCAASGLTLIDDPVARHRALYRFAVGHLLLGLMLWSQWGALWADRGMALEMALVPLVTGALLLAVAVMMSRLGEPPTSLSLAKLRSTYEEHIRQLARREERSRLARDLHDAVKQQLFVVQTAAATAQTRFDDDAAGARAAIEQVRSAAREATTEMEALLEELHAVPMENIGLVEALRKQCEALAFRTGAEVQFDNPVLPSNESLPPGAHEAIYRVAQEALANVARHARATRVTVTVRTSTDRLELRVVDNGVGFDAGMARQGMGRENMESRAAEVGGRLTVASTSAGTDVILSLPLRTPAGSPKWAMTWFYGALVLATTVSHWVRGSLGGLLDQVFFAALIVFFVWLVVFNLRRHHRRSVR